ncbi:MAG: hypothetical protein ACI9VR_001400 [Cognaticolwellia sp.]
MLSRQDFIMLSLLPLLIACNVNESTDALFLEGVGLTAVNIDVQAGDVSYRGGYSDLEMQVRSWGASTDPETADSREDGNSWGLDRQGDIAQAWARSQSWNAGTDLTLLGPTGVVSDWLLQNGDLEIRELSGDHYMEADNVDLFNVSGSLEVVADRVDASLAPGAGDVIHIIADGPVNLELPWSRGYDLTVWGDPEAEMVIEDFGFGRVATSPGYFAGVSGGGEVRVIIETNSSVNVRAF